MESCGQTRQGPDAFVALSAGCPRALAGRLGRAHRVGLGRRPCLVGRGGHGEATVSTEDTGGRRASRPAPRGRGRAGLRGSALSPAARSAWRGRTRTVRAAAPASLRTPNPRTRRRTNRSRPPSRAQGGETERRRRLERRPVRASAERAEPPRPRARHPGTCSLWRGQIETWPAADCESLGDFYLSHKMNQPEKSWTYPFQQIERSLYACVKKHWPQGSCFGPVGTIFSITDDIPDTVLSTFFALYISFSTNL